MAIAGAWFALAMTRALPADGGYDWNLPAGFPRPVVPLDNPMSVARVELGRHLFYDLRLSGNGRQSCASCHQQARAYTDGRARSRGSTGEMHPRGMIDHYAAGGRTIAEGRYAGVGRENPNKSGSIRGFSLTANQRADLVAFLESLTDEALLRDPRFANPWPDR